jgi:DDHD domain
VTIRGIEKLGVDFQLPTCENFFNIFHPYDPVAYRIEPLVNAELASLNPLLIPHHKGRKRMHLELKETLQQVSADIKTKFMSSVKNVTETVCALNPLNKSVNQKAIEKEVDQALNKQLEMEGAPAVPSPESPAELSTELNLGILNQGRRIDNVLQEAPLEFFNEYVWALQSHVCYWNSADTILFIVKEIYTSLGIEADREVPQHTMKIERPNSTDLIVPSTSG